MVNLAENDSLEFGFLSSVPSCWSKHTFPFKAFTFVSPANNKRRDENFPCAVDIAQYIRCEFFRQHHHSDGRARAILLLYAIHFISMPNVCRNIIKCFLSWAMSSASWTEQKRGKQSKPFKNENFFFTPFIAITGINSLGAWVNECMATTALLPFGNDVFIGVI